jgi:hypothetical protein
MTSDIHLQDQQDAFDEWQRNQKALEAATLVANGVSRDSAVQIIKNTYDAQEDSSENEIIRGEDGDIEYLLPEAQTPVVPKDPQALAQVKAIAKELIDEFD